MKLTEKQINEASKILSARGGKKRAENMRLKLGEKGYSEYMTNMAKKKRKKKSKKGVVDKSYCK